MTFLRSARRLALAVLVLGGCECMCDDTPPGVQHSGDVAPCSDEVIAACAAICPRDLRGYVTWVPDPFDCRSVWSTGCSQTGGCHLDATIEYDPAYMRDARFTALAHEIGHYCLETTDETAASAFAVQVREAVTRRGGWACDPVAALERAAPVASNDAASAASGARPRALRSPGRDLGPDRRAPSRPRPCSTARGT